MRMGPRDSNWRKILPPLGLNLHRREQLLEPGMQMSDTIHIGAYMSMYAHLIDTAAENSYKCFAPTKCFLSGQWEEDKNSVY